MKNQKAIAVFGAVLLLTGEIVPIAKLGPSFISVIPLWNNINLYNGMWEWRDISFFAVTLMLLAAISAGMIIKGKYKGLLFTGYISLFAVTIIFIAIFLIKANLLVSNTVNFIVSWGWIFLLAGSILLILSGASVSNTIKDAS